MFKSKKNTFPPSNVAWLDSCIVVCSSETDFGLFKQNSTDNKISYPHAVTTERKPEQLLNGGRAVGVEYSMEHPSSLYVWVEWYALRIRLLFILVPCNWQKRRDTTAIRAAVNDEDVTRTDGRVIGFIEYSDENVIGNFIHLLPAAASRDSKEIESWWISTNSYGGTDQIASRVMHDPSLVSLQGVFDLVWEKSINVPPMYSIVLWEGPTYFIGFWGTFQYRSVLNWFQSNKCLS